jgi:phosphoglycolate phosphatase-like HAD superfamily hydrolase
MLARHATLVVVTSKPTVYTRLLLDGLDLGRYLAGTFAPALTALDETKTTTRSRALGWFAPQAAVMVGDRGHDMTAGRVWKADTVGVTWGIGSADDCDAPAPTY